MNRSVGGLLLLALASTVLSDVRALSADAPSPAKEDAESIRFSTLFTARSVRDVLGDEPGRDRAVAWCRETGITHVYLESFRGGYLVPSNRMAVAVEHFRREGFGVSGCITTVEIGRDSVDGWIFPCFTEPEGLENLRHIVETTAGQFDEIMIDDFFATLCQCEDCVEKKGEDSWAAFRTDLLVDVSRRFVIDPARRANPNCRLILKYPQWYADFQTKGYDIVRQTPMFDRTWVGTETRDPDNDQWGRHPQYMAMFIMRWLGIQGGDACGGGWFDPYGTSPATYVEQARQTILGGAREALLFCYGALQKDTGPANVRAFRDELPELLALARLVDGKPIRGIHAPKPGNSEGAADRYMYDFLGMLGLPLVPALALDPDVPSAILGHAVLHQEDALPSLDVLLHRESPVLLTETLVTQLPEALRNRIRGADVLPVPEDKWDWMDMDPDLLNARRNTLLRPFGVQLTAPSRVSLTLLGNDLFVLQNFNDHPVEVRLVGDGDAPLKPILVLKKGQAVSCTEEDGETRLTIPARTLVALQ